MRFFYLEVVFKQLNEHLPFDGKYSFAKIENILLFFIFMSIIYIRVVENIKRTFYWSIYFDYYLKYILIIM